MAHQGKPARRRVHVVMVPPASLPVMSTESEHAITHPCRGTMILIGGDYEKLRPRTGQSDFVTEAVVPDEGITVSATASTLGHERFEVTSTVYGRSEPHTLDTPS